MKSDWSMDKPRTQFREEDGSTDHGIQQKIPSGQSSHSDENPTQDFLSDYDEVRRSVQLRVKSCLQTKFQYITEGTAKHRNPALLNDVYTELYVTEGDSGEVNNEHEVRQIETVSRRPETQDTPIKCNDIFKPLPGQDKPIRTVLTKGVAGIGKTVSVQKFVLDWAEGKANQQVYLMFPLPFRELNLMKDRQCNMKDLLHHFFPEIKGLKCEDLDNNNIIFILDGLDECRLSLGLQDDRNLCDLEKSTSVDVLLTNLIKGNLLPSALLWITSRPAAANHIPPECIQRVTEVRGFSGPQKEEYFKKRISDEKLASRVFAHVKSSRSLYIMCHIPVFCWISATVLERMLDEAESGEIPKTLTQMYAHYLIIQTEMKEKYTERKGTNEEIIFKLGRLAFHQLEKGNLIFYEEDLRECGIDVREASVYSGVCTQIFREELGLYQGKVYSFVHLSLQEFLAALFVFLSSINKVNTAHSQTGQLSDLFHQKTMSETLKTAVDKALQSENGHLDLFLRFLLGLSLESNKTLLQGLLSVTGSSSQGKEEIVSYIKEKIRENPSAEKSINLFYCLNELNDRSLVEEVQRYLKGRGDVLCLSGVRLSPAQWSALVFVLLTSEEKLEEFDQTKFAQSEQCTLRMLPVIKMSRKAMLANCELTEKSCADLAQALSSNSACLTELNLSGNYLQDSGVKLLSAGLRSPNCKLQKLWLCYCELTEESCTHLASVLGSESSSLRYLNLRNNDLQDTGVKKLSAGLTNPNCKLESLMLYNCYLTGKSCEALALALHSETSSLRFLDLSHNNLQNSGVSLLSDGLKNPHCKLQTLKLFNCKLTERSCAALASVLSSTSSSLRDLDLGNNKLQDLGVKQLCVGLENPHCKLETIKISGCNLTEESGVTLASVLSLQTSSLRDLELGDNKLQDSGVKQLSAGLQDPHCKLRTLRLFNNQFTEEGCAALSAALRSNPSLLTELDLSKNTLGDVGANQLSALLGDPDCNLEKLELRQCSISDEDCNSLASAIRSNPSQMRELDLKYNKITDLGKKLLSALQEDSKLEKLKLRKSKRWIVALRNYTFTAV
ncbi:NACHT, LRR and PYD domains-containing protein 3-like [Chanos chanos]|uniref:NACHT, LRR and PYD domains-containing protein 3-like n=1 Tax=Chanos chanos TaxID=29144 RepID=A0A6J2W4T4_CHACN|nr:NACHT, LRR and PYD domains-containing protein 3-like [Chanos chanos]